MINKEAIPFQKVDSSQMTGVYYHKDNQQLYIKFKNKDVWMYDNVTSTEYSDFMDAESFGKHFHSQIKSNHFATKL